MFCSSCWYFGWNVWWACSKTLSCLLEGLHMVSIGTHIVGDRVQPILILHISLNNVEIGMFKINILLALPKTQTLCSTHAHAYIVPHIYCPPFILSRKARLHCCWKVMKGNRCPFHLEFHNSTQELTTAGNCGLSSNEEMQLYLLFCQRVQ